MSVSVLVTAELALAPSLERAWLNELPPARRDELGRWPSRHERHRSLLASRLLLAQLRRLGHGDGALATLRYPARARPTLDLPLHWSVAHCDGRVAVAVSTAAPVGIDVEALGVLRADDFRLYLSATERAWAGRSAHRFYSVWTRKEAVAKAAGTAGLASVPAVDTTPGRGRAGFAGRLWRTVPIAVGAGHVGHVATAALDATVKCEQVDPQALL